MEKKTLEKYFPKQGCWKSEQALLHLIVEYNQFWPFSIHDRNYPYYVLYSGAVSKMQYP